MLAIANRDRLVAFSSTFSHCDAKSPFSGAKRSLFWQALRSRGHSEVVDPVFLRRSYEGVVQSRHNCCRAWKKEALASRRMRLGPLPLDLRACALESWFYIRRD